MSKPFDVDIVLYNKNGTQGFIVPEDWIVDQIEISREESTASLMTFTVQPPSGEQMDRILYAMGKKVTLDYTDNLARKTRRMYTGRIDIPEIDMLAGRITFRCTDNRTEILNAYARENVESIGVYSEDVFGEFKDQAQELEYRLETVEQALDVNSYGQLELANWEPKEVPDFNLTDNLIYRRTPRIEILSRGRVMNKVNLELTYQYQTLRHREREFRWTMLSSYKNGDESDNGSTTSRDLKSLCTWSAKQYPYPPKKDLLRSAINAAGWHIKELKMGDMACGNTWCNDVVSGGQRATSGVGYTCGTYTTSPRLDPFTNKPVLDANGKPKTQLSSYTYLAGNYTDDARWTVARRFSQNTIETAKITITAPQSTEQYGVIESEERAGVTADYDGAAWDNIQSYQAPVQPNWVKVSSFTNIYKNIFTGQTDNVSNLLLPQSPNGDYYLKVDNYEGSYKRWDQLFRAQLLRAVTKIRAAHRDNTVSIEIPLLPSIELKHTIQTSGSWINCKGKVGAIRHVIDIGEKDVYSEIDIKLSRVEGTPPAGFTTSSAQVRPTITDAPFTPTMTSLGVVTKKKGEEIAPQDKGLILSQVNTYTKTIIAFVADTEEIEDEARDDKKAETNTNFEIGIRNDYLQVSFNP